MAGGPGESSGLEGCREEWSQGGMPGLYKRGLDRYAATQFEEEDGRSCAQSLAHSYSTADLSGSAMSNIMRNCSTRYRHYALSGPSIE